MEDWFNRRIKPMLAVRGKPFSSDDYIYEIKWDGTRCIAFVDVEKKKLRLQNRRLIEIAYRYPELDFFDFVSQNSVLDGEIVVFHDGKPSFPLLQQREHVDSRLKIEVLSRRIPAVYIAFDVLYTASDGWIMNLPLIERRKILNEVAGEARRITKSEFIERAGVELYKKAIEMGLEGVMAKRKNSIYQPGKRSGAWVKMKKRKTLECIIVGWLEGEGVREGKFGSLVLALKSGDKLVHVGQVGTGFDAEFIDWFYGKLKEIEISTPWFEAEFKRRVHWVKPVYVCEVEFLEVTEDGKLRAPVFLRLRDDKAWDECTVEGLYSLID
ncbi:MAG: DNA ligase [Archaeoglobales archaeon]|nr:MAG: DNA ligase [Archaeoglobales archaeon]